MTDSTHHFYGDDCDPPHTEDFLDEIIRESTERDPEFPQKLAAAEGERAKRAAYYSEDEGDEEQWGKL